MREGEGGDGGGGTRGREGGREGSKPGRAGRADGRVVVERRGLGTCGMMERHLAM